MSKQHFHPYRWVVASEHAEGAEDWLMDFIEQYGKLTGEQDGFWRVRVQRSLSDPETIAEFIIPEALIAALKDQLDGIQLGRGPVPCTCDEFRGFSLPAVQGTSAH